MTIYLDPLAHDDAVVAALVTTGKPVGYTKAPAGALDGVINRNGPGYYVVYPVDGGGRDGTAANPDDMAVLPYRIHCIDRDPRSAAGLARRAEQALPSLTVAGRHVMRVEPITRGAVREHDDLEGVFYAAPLWHIHTSPA